jgi:hypothetical protein
MPFTNMPLRFRVESQLSEIGGKVGVRFEAPTVLLRFRPDYEDCDDHMNRVKVQTRLSCPKGRVEILEAYGPTGTEKLRKRYWKLIDVAADGAERLMKLGFDSARFTKDVLSGDDDPGLRNLYDAVLTQQLVQLRLDLGEGDSTTLLLTL